MASSKFIDNQSNELTAQAAELQESSYGATYNIYIQQPANWRKDDKLLWNSTPLQGSAPIDHVSGCGRLQETIITRLFQTKY